MKMNRGFAPVLFVLVAILLISTAFAQETTAGLQGTVRDPQGLAVSKAVVEISGSALIGTKKLETDSSGYYRFANLPPGEYTIVTTATNFRTLKQTGLKLEVGKMPTLDLKLEVGTVEQTVEVSSDAPIVDVTESKVQTIVSSDILAGIPKGRSFQSVITFAPGARQEPLQSTNRGSNGFSVEGASDGENSYLVEGMDTTDVYAGGVGKNVPMEFVQEVQVKSSGFEAEFGGALGGVVNVIQKRGSNAWHGSAFTHFRTDALNANDQCGNMTLVNSVNCGLRTVPGTSNNASTRTSAPNEYYITKKDHQRIIDPGFEIGGFLNKDRLWLFTSYVPTIERLSRTVNFNYTGVGGPKLGPRTYSLRDDSHNALSRIDWLATNKIRTYSAWQYGYRRRSGISLPVADSAIGQTNTNATVDPDQFRQDRGTVNPNSVFNFGGDITLTEKLIATVRYGYWFSNLADRGTPVGTRYLYGVTASAAEGLTGCTYVPDPDPTKPGTYTGCERLSTVDSSRAVSAYSNMTSNRTQLFDSFKRNSLTTDASYFTKGFFGTHSLKFGYANNRIKNSILTRNVDHEADIFFGTDYSPLTPGACDTIIAENQTLYGTDVDGLGCRGRWGYYTVTDYRVRGDVSSNNHALYAQDGWTLGKGVTLNLGIRFDKEFLPAYTQGAPTVSFGFGDKIAPRLGGAWDVMQNGKLKLYGSFGLFYDIMKYSLPRGAFGGEYWHDCTYALDSTNFTAIQPALNSSGFSCPTVGAPTGTLPGRFIENVNYRSVTLDPSDPGVVPGMKPMKQHEWVIGADYAFTNMLGLETRYSHKALDRTIEDVGVTVPGNELYYIGNPGFGNTANVLQRPVTDSSAVPYGPAVTYPAACPTCPLTPKATRSYDGVEFRLIKKPTDKWFASMSYTYSRLRGNYSGLTSSDVSDAASNAVGAGGGRHNPNVSRAFDMPFMQFDSHGKPIDGPLGTDRPHTFKAFGYYRAKWFGQETMLGVTQLAYSGTPLSTCLGLISTQSSCQFVEGRGSVVDFTRAANGDLVQGAIHRNSRTPIFTQSDLFLSHEFRPSKTKEEMRLGFEWNVSNLFNQRAVLSKYLTPTTSIVTPLNGAGTFDWMGLTSTGWNYTTAANTTNSTQTTGRILDSRYQLPNLFQTGRQMRLKVKFVF
jgi:hypothetical protein